MEKIGIINLNTNCEKRFLKGIENLEDQVQKLSEKNVESELIRESSLIVIYASKLDEHNRIRNCINSLKNKTNIRVLLVITNKSSEKQLEYADFKLGEIRIIGEESRFSKIDMTLKKYLDKAKTGKQLDIKFELIKKRRMVVINKKTEIYLTQLEFILMECFIRHAGELVDYNKLIKSAWGYDYCITKSQLANVIFRLRRKLDDKNKSFIKTVQSRGYVLTCR